MNDRRATIRGDELLKAFHFMQRYAANDDRTPGSKDVDLSRYPPMIQQIFSGGHGHRQIPLAHVYGLHHWIGEIAIRAHVRRVLDETKGELALLDQYFIIHDVVRNALREACPEELGPLGLSKHDKATVIEVLSSLLHAVAKGKLSTPDLLGERSF